MTMQIAVLVKQVPDHEAIVRVESEQRLNIEDRYACSYFDEIALEAALVLQKSHADTQVTALAAGGVRAMEALRRAVAMGIDKVVHLGDQSLERLDSFSVAQVLTAKLKTLNPDLVLCGKQAGDDDMGAVGPMVAELLGIPHVNAAVSLELDPDLRRAKVGRKSEGEVWILEGSLPLLVAADKGLAEPHLPVVTRVMKAMKAKIDSQSVGDLGMGGIQPERRLRRVRYLPPASRPEVRMLAGEISEKVKRLVHWLQESGTLIGRLDRGRGDG